MLSSGNNSWRRAMCAWWTFSSSKAQHESSFTIQREGCITYCTCTTGNETSYIKSNFSMYTKKLPYNLSVLLLVGIHTSTLVFIVPHSRAERGLYQIKC